MLESLEVKNFTVFASARLCFTEGLNVIIGGNGLGKTHLLKLPYAVMAVSAEEGRKSSRRPPTRTLLQARLAENLVNVFRAERLGRLARRQQGQKRCRVRLAFREPGASIEFGFALQSKSEVAIDRSPSVWLDRAPVFLPARELLTLYPLLVSRHETHHGVFDETWRDTCRLLGSPMVKAPHKIPKTLVRPLRLLEKQIGGQTILERNGHFYLRRPTTKDMEVPLMAEGSRKLAMAAHLIATGALLGKDCLFWDEPEANLDPKLIREVAKVILLVCRAGVQVVLSTHSLFFLRELEILLNREFRDVGQRCFAPRRGVDGLEVSQADRIVAADPPSPLDEPSGRSNRFLEDLRG